MTERSEWKWWMDQRAWIAIVVLGTSIGGLAVIAGLIITRSEGDEPAKHVLNVLLPVFAAWVGTILAFYFSRENFEAASRSVIETIKEVGPMTKLKAMPVTEHMIKLEEMAVERLTGGKTEAGLKLVGDILERMKAETRNRLPILDDKDHLKYIIHRSMIEQFLSKKALEAGAKPSDLKNLSFKDLLDEDENLRRMFKTSFAVVSEGATMADAKVAMEGVRDCLDVFVTKSGVKDEPVLGWVTNVMITKCAQL